MSDAENQKLQTHLSLLRDEYVKLQRRLVEVEKKYQVVLAATGQSEEDNFVSRLLKIVSDLFDRELYSDLTIRLDGKDLHGHRFVLAARSDTWGVSDLSQVAMLDLTDISFEVSYALLKWVYTDRCDLSSVDDSFLLHLLRAARRFHLDPLSTRCEQALMSSINVRNCIKYYQVADEIGAHSLREHCSLLISSHWNDFTSDDFASMSATLAYQMFKTKTEHPLHTAIRHKREDVVFLYLVEHDSQLPGKLNELDGRGDLPIDLALQSRAESIAQTLVKHRADVNRPDQQGLCLLHKAIKRGDDYSARFLIENKTNVNAASSTDKETPLHLVASFRPESVVAGGGAPADMLEKMAAIATLLLKHGADPNVKDSAQRTPLHRCLTTNNFNVFSILLAHDTTDLDLQDAEGHSVLWLALTVVKPRLTDAQQSINTDDYYPEDSFARQLITRGSSPNLVSNKDTGDTLLHLSARKGFEAAGLFLARYGANVNIPNRLGETALHVACAQGLPRLVAALLDKGANANAQTLSTRARGVSGVGADMSTRSRAMSGVGAEVSPNDTSAGEGDYEASMIVGLQTPLHLAITSGHRDVVTVILDFKVKSIQSGDNLQIIPNLSLKNSAGQTALGVSIWSGHRDVAKQLIAAGANVNDIDSEGRSLLQQAILKLDVDGALFLLQNQADINTRMPDGETCLQLAVRHRLPAVVDSLCHSGSSTNAVYIATGNCILWDALAAGQLDIATILVNHGCDVNMWSEGPNSCQQTLLHRAIDENNEEIACFLIRSKCDVNSPRKPGLNGECEDEAKDQQGPLHLSCTWGLVKVVQCLLDYNADVNAKDAEGETPLHIAIQNQHEAIISLLLRHPRLDVMARNRKGLTSFSVAMATKNNKAASAILDREPTATEQFDNRGRNFLHLAIQKSDIEAVLFLISVHANVNSRLQDSSQMTPLHLAVISGAEIICRHLLLAGANVNDVTPQKQTALHLAALHDRSTICTILVENNIDYDALDDSLNNALHIAVQQGHLSCVRVLLSVSRINAEAINMRGQNPLHVLAVYGKENSAAIFELFMDAMPQYPIDQLDANGNPDMLSKEPPWVEGETCLECGVRFGIKTRKHHCRHCGRLLCAKCSDKDMPIIKYSIPKPVRICDICFDVLSLGSSS